MSAWLALFGGWDPFAPALETFALTRGPDTYRTLISSRSSSEWKPFTVNGRITIFFRSSSIRPSSRTKRADSGWAVSARGVDPWRWWASCGHYWFWAEGR